MTWHEVHLIQLTVCTDGDESGTFWRRLTTNSTALTLKQALSLWAKKGKEEKVNHFFGCLSDVEGYVTGDNYYARTFMNSDP